jgi:hypothetical protein
MAGIYHFYGGVTANILNNSTILNENTRYSTTNNQWMNAIQIMGGRLLKFSAQLIF